MPEYITKTTPDVPSQQIERLKQLFPECVTEGKVDFDLLRATLGDTDALSGEDAYTFTWAGKEDAFRAIQTPSAASLKPAPEESVNWDETQHLFIEGENLEVLKLLYKSYFGKVKMIYIDPPYNTGNDFIYQDDYSQPRRAYLEKTGQMDAEGNLLTSNPETSGRYHSDWLSMMYPRLFLARQLLREDGVIFISIDDHEVHNLRLMMNEIFGEENFLANICWERADSPKMDADHFSTQHDYILCYAKTIRSFKVNRIMYTGDNIPEHYDKIDKQGREYYLKPLRAMGGQGETREARPTLFYGIEAPDKTIVYPKLQSGEDGAWRWSKGKFQEESNRIEWVSGKSKWTPYYRIYADESPGKPPETILYHKQIGSTRTATAELKEIFQQGKFFDTPKPTELIKYLVKITTEKNDVIFDFFAGSGTTAHVILDLNKQNQSKRKFVCVQIPEVTPQNSTAWNAGYKNVADIGKERIRRVIKQMQAESPEESESQANAQQMSLALEKSDQSPRHLQGAGDFGHSQDLGFKVFKLAPSTFRQWELPEEETGDSMRQQLSFFDTGLEEDVDLQDVIYEVILKEGYSLNAAIEQLDLETNQVFKVAQPEVPRNPRHLRGAGDFSPGGSLPRNEQSQFFYICLDDQIQTETLESLNLEKETKFICLDTALDDSQKVNLAMGSLLKVI